MAQDESTNPDRKSPGFALENDGNHSSSTVAAILSPKYPRKSILKHKDSENATVPVSFGSRTVENEVIKPLERRVSFAEKVQLHQIAVVSGSHGQSSSADEREHSHENGDESFDENSSSDINSSFSALEADADNILSALRTSGGPEKNTGQVQNIDAFVSHAIPENSSHSHESKENEEGSENSMELTEPISRPVPENVKIGDSKNETLDFTQKPEKGNRVESASLLVESAHSDHSGQPEPNKNELHPGLLTIDDQITGHYPPPDFEYNRINQFSHTGDEKLVHGSNYAPSLTSSEDLLDGEEDMEFTSQVAKFNFEELTMELTLPQSSNFQSTLTRSAGFENSVGVFGTSTASTGENGHIQSSQNAEEITMDFTQPVENLGAHSQKEEEEITMDLTKPFGDKSSNHVREKHDVPHPQEDENGGSDEETAMELTEPVNSAVEHPNSISKIDEHDTINTHVQEEKSPILGVIQDTEPTNSQVHQSADLSTIEEEMETESQGETQYGPANTAVPETVQTPTNVEIPDEDAEYLMESRIVSSSRDSSSSSVSDMNVYDNDSADENANGKHSLRPAMNPSPPKRQKTSPNDNINMDLNSEENEISYDDVWTVADISLPEFLEEIEIKFYDDLEFETGTSARYQTSASNTYPHSKEEYYRANVQLPLWDIHELCCKELTAKIQQGKVLFDEIKERTLRNNPVLFKQYLSASPYEKMAMKSKFHLMKEYTKQQAKEVWYEWRKKLIGNIIEVYKSNLEILKNDKSILEARIISLDHSYQSVIRKLQSLKFDFQKFKELQSDLKSYDIAEIAMMRARMTDLNQSLIQHKGKISEKQSQIQTLQEKIEGRGTVIKSLKSQIQSTDEQLNKRKHFNSKEIEGLQVTSSILQACAGVQYVGSRDQIYNFELDPRIRLSVDTTKLHTPNSFSCKIVERNETKLFNASLANVFLDLFNSVEATNAVDKFKKVGQIWRKLKLIDQEIFAITLKFPFKFQKRCEASIEFQFEYLSANANIKVECNLSIPKKDILRYPECVTFNAKVSRGDGDSDRIIQNAIHEAGKNLTMFAGTN